MAKAKVGFQHDSIAQKIQKTTVILDSIEGNAAFPGAQALVPPLRARLSDLGAKSQQADASQTATKALFIEQGQIESDVDALTAGLCTEVNQEADGNETEILSSGFELARAATAAAVPGPISDFSLTRGDHPGVVDGQCHSVKNARAYESRFIVAAMPEGDWTSGPSFFGSKFEWTGLASGSTVWIEVRASGTAGQGPWSDALSIVVG